MTMLVASLAIGFAFSYGSPPLTYVPSREHDRQPTSITVTPALSPMCKPTMLAKEPRSTRQPVVNFKTLLSMSTRSFHVLFGSGLYLSLGMLILAYFSQGAVLAFAARGIILKSMALPQAARILVNLFFGIWGFACSIYAIVLVPDSKVSTEATKDPIQQQLQRRLTRSGLVWIAGLLPILAVFGYLPAADRLQVACLALLAALGAFLSASFPDTAAKSLPFVEPAAYLIEYIAILLG